MLTTPLHDAKNTTSAVLPTASQLHQGQLQDYELLLDSLRSPFTSITDFKNKLFRPRPFSPLDQENETGQSALQQLMKDTEYRAYCAKKNVSPHYLTVTLKDGAYAYETSNREGKNKTALTLNGNPNWSVLQTRIEASVPLLGGQIRYDRLVSLPGFATFYGIASWDPTHATEHQQAIDTLEEKLASFRSGLEDNFNIVDFRPSPVKHDLEASDSTLSVAALRSKARLRKVHTQFASREIKQIIQSCLPDETTSLLTHLAGDILSSAATDRVRAVPSVYLEKILRSKEAEEFGNHLLSQLDWYGGKSAEESSPHIRTGVIANAMRIWFQSPPTELPERIAGYDWQARSNWGKSYQSIRNEFETHLLTSRKASSEKEAIVLARLFLRQFPIEFRIADIPADLAYRSSVVWVNFLNGVNLAKAIDPALLRRLTFQQLVNLPLNKAEGASAEQLSQISLTRLPATLDWAKTQGVIPDTQGAEYTRQDIDLAVSELDKHTKELNDVITQLNEKPPERFTIAKKEMEKLLGKGAFISDGRKLAKEPVSGGFTDTPRLRGHEFDYFPFIEVLASDEFKDHERWLVTDLDGITVRQQWIRMDEHRSITTGRSWPIAGLFFAGRQMVLIPHAKLPDVKELFDKDFNRYQERVRAAYETLIKSLLASLPFSDRQALELGTLTLHTLRKETYRVEAKYETPEKILPLRARYGLLLHTTYKGQIRTYELLPKAGVIRNIDTLAPSLFGGKMKTENWPIGMNSNSVKVLRHKTLPFDWNAHSTGAKPKNAATCEAIIEQLGQTFMAPSQSVENTDSIPLSITSSRCLEISKFISTHLPFNDPVKLRKDAYGQTIFEQDKAHKKNILEAMKTFVPFWKSIEDASSDDPKRNVNGAFGLSMDLVAFAQPVGKLVSGSAKMISNSARLALSLRLPAFTSTMKSVSIQTLQALTPLDGIPQLLTGLGLAGLKLSKSAIFKFKLLSGRAGHFDFKLSLPQISDGSSWKPLVSGDQLAMIKGIDDVPVRNIAPSGEASYRLVDPLSSKPYGPALTSSELSLGRSHYRTMTDNDNQHFIKLPANARVHELPEVDGRTTLIIDNLAYRLDNGRLVRADLVDADDTFKAIPCRVRRAPGATCESTYANSRTPAPPPDIGSFDQSKGWAPWFGDVIYTPATGRAAMPIASIRAHSSLNATLEFQKGIYGRVMVSVPVAGEPLVDNFRVGAILVQAQDNSRHYVFMRLNAGDFFVSECLEGQSLRGLMTFKKAQTLPQVLKDELMTVYTGSLNANNMVAIHGQEAVERALKTMEEIAIPIGSHVNPPDTLKLLKVDTSPGEAALFDHATRMIIRRSTDGAASWSLSKAASDNVRETTATVFNHLFQKTVITVTSSSLDGPKALKIDNTMRQLQRLISSNTGRPIHSPRNIAFVEVKPKTGGHEVYVSVSGNQGDTGYLPLFAKNRHSGEVKVGNISYFNIDHRANFPQTALSVTAEGKIQAIPHTIDNIETYTPQLTSRPTSLDTESKLISVIRQKYPDPKQLDSITIATTMAPCDSCSVVMKQFGYDGNPAALDVIWK
jgi:hypothetical protein